MFSKWWIKSKYLRKFPDCKISSDLRIVGPISNLHLGNNIEIQHNVFFHLGGFEWCNNKGLLKIGDNACISHDVIIYGCGDKGVEIGKNFDCGPRVTIVSSKTNVNDSGKHDFSKVQIGNNVTLYSNVVVSPGAIIEDNCVIGANSVVTSTIPKNSLALGNPARVVKSNIRLKA